MRSQMLFVLLVLIVLGAFAALNWAALTVPAPLNLLVVRVEAPLGLIMLVTVGALTVLYLALTLGLQAAALLETKRYARDALTQRKLADDAEASRFTELRNYLESELAQLKTGPADAARQVIERVALAEETLKREVHDAGNTLAAYIGELEGRLKGGESTVAGA